MSDLQDSFTLSPSLTGYRTEVLIIFFFFKTSKNLSGDLTLSMFNFRDLFLVHCSLIKNKTQTAAIDTVRFRIFINLTFSMLFNIHFQIFVCNISRLRHTLSSPDKTPRRELKIRRSRSTFDELRGVSSVDETLCRMPDITSQTK